MSQHESQLIAKIAKIVAEHVEYGGESPAEAVLRIAYREACAQINRLGEALRVATADLDACRSERDRLRSVASPRTLAAAVDVTGLDDAQFHDLMVRLLEVSEDLRYNLVEAPIDRVLSAINLLASEGAT